MLRRFGTLRRCELAAQSFLERGTVGFHKRIKPDAGAAVGEGDDGGVADIRVFPDLLEQDRRVVDQPPAAAFAVGEVEQAAGDGAVDLLAGHQPEAGDRRFARQDPALGRRQRLRRVAALVLEEMSQVFIGRDPEQLAARLEAGGELEVRDIGTAIGAAQPVLFLGEIVMADAGAMHFSQRLLGGAEIGGIAMRLGHLQRHAIDEAAHQRLFAGPQQFRPDIEVARQRQRAGLASEQVARR